MPAKMVVTGLSPSRLWLTYGTTARGLIGYFGSPINWASDRTTARFAYLPCGALATPLCRMAAKRAIC